jgi:hypothetical protein
MVASMKMKLKPSGAVQSHRSRPKSVRCVLEIISVCISETSAYFYNNTWHHIPEGCHLQIICSYENALASHLLLTMRSPKFSFITWFSQPRARSGLNSSHILCSFNGVYTLPVAHNTSFTPEMYSSWMFVALENQHTTLLLPTKNGIIHFAANKSSWA